ncbi:MAG: hypothetical protein AB2693_08535 [Candidatus Thiodiazotropha sp.]
MAGLETIAIHTAFLENIAVQHKNVSVHLVTGVLLAVKSVQVLEIVPVAEEHVIKGRVLVHLIDMMLTVGVNCVPWVGVVQTVHLLQQMFPVSLNEWV